ncbi:hypothetical protein QTP88_023116 [Uroleucon formosanum]
MPVGVASAERSFSTLHRMKTWLQFRRGETRLIGLCLLHVHREVNIKNLIQSVIDRFANKKQRRLTLFCKMYFKYKFVRYCVYVPSRYMKKNCKESGRSKGLSFRNGTQLFLLPLINNETLSETCFL